MKRILKMKSILLGALLILSNIFSINIALASQTTEKHINDCVNESERASLTFCQLTTSLKANDTINMKAFISQGKISSPTNNFQGRLVLSGEATSGNFKFRGGIKAYDTPEKHHLPEFDFEFIQDGDDIIPVERGVIRSFDGKDQWEYILEPGKVWNEAADYGFSRAAIPFALQLTNQNCVHNGVLSFLFNNDGAISNVYYQISSETCLTYKADFWGT